MTDDSERWSDEVWWNSEVEMTGGPPYEATVVYGHIKGVGEGPTTESAVARAWKKVCDRLRGGEGERLRRAARKVARMRRSTSNSLAGGMSEALNELNEALGPVVTAEQAERVHEGHSVAVCPGCGRQQGDLHHPACPLADGDALSPTDGEERMTMEEFMEWTPPIGEPVGEDDPRPEEAGGEDDLLREYTNLAVGYDRGALLEAEDKRLGELEQEIRDRLRGAPEGAGEEADRSGRVREAVLEEIRRERSRQIDKWGDRTIPGQGRTAMEWAGILGEEFGELAEAGVEAHFADGDPEDMMKEAIQTAAVATAIAEACAREAIQPRLRTGREEEDDE